MTIPISAESAPHYLWGDGCHGWHFVRTPALSVIQERMPPGTAEVRHRHTHSRQFFFVLSGELAIEADGARHTLTGGIGVEIAPGVAHQVVNRGVVDAEFLVVSQPPSHGDREALGELR